MSVPCSAVLTFNPVQSALLSVHFLLLLGLSLLLVVPAILSLSRISPSVFRSENYVDHNISVFHLCIFAKTAGSVQICSKHPVFVIPINSPKFEIYHTDEKC